MGKSKRVTRHEERKSARKRKQILQIGVFAVVVVIAGTAWAATRPPQSPPIPPDREAIEQSIGPSDAKITIVEFGDFNCPSCKQYHELGIIDRILSEYPLDVRFVFRHFPVITAVSPELAEASECASDQGSFWDFHNMLYTFAPSQPREMNSYASQLDLDLIQFDECTTSRQYAELVESQMQEAFQIGFRGTPSFLVNETPLAGPPSYGQLKTMIDTILTN
jgi:protein-disulfide isomerase